MMYLNFNTMQPQFELPTNLNCFCFPSLRLLEFDNVDIFFADLNDEDTEAPGIGWRR